jgi:hypothetical protein
MHIMHFDQIHPVYITFFQAFLSLPFQQLLVSFLMFISHIHVKYLGHVQPPSLSSLLLPTPTALQSVMSYYYFFLGLDSIYE